MIVAIRRLLKPFLLLLTAAISLPPAASAQSPQAVAPGEYLLQTLNDPAEAFSAMQMLASTKDAELVPIFAAIARSEDQHRRLFAAAQLRMFDCSAASEALLERLNSDASMEIRGEALAGLLQHDAISVEQLTGVLAMPDETLQCLAGKALCEKGRADLTIDTLQGLLRSGDEVTVMLAQLGLLKAGSQDHLPALLTMLRDDAPERTLALMMKFIADGRIEAARPLVDEAVASRSGPLRVEAFKALSAISAAPPPSLVETVAKGKDLVERVYLLHVLADRQDATMQLETLSAGSDILAMLARFELARRLGGEAMSLTCREAVALGHPVVINYVLDRSGEDISAGMERAGSYVPALLDVLRSVQKGSPIMSQEHIRAAAAAAMLTTIGSDEAVAGLRSVLSGRYSPAVRAAGAGLVRSNSDSAVELAQPLLMSAYEELRSDATLVLGRFGQPQADDQLRRILADPQSHPPGLAAIAAWYLLKTSGRSAVAAEAIAAGLD